MLLLNPQDSEITEETPCKILPLPLVVNSSARKSDYNSKVLMFQFLVMPERLSSLRMIPSSWEVQEPRMMLLRELILSRNKLMELPQSTTRRNSKKDLEDLLVVLQSLRLEDHLKLK